MKRAQTAMEYLMTYGWALFIVALVIGTLVALGVFRVEVFHSKYATGFAMLGKPGEWRLDEDGILDMLIENDLAKKITVYALNATIDEIMYSYNTFNCTGNNQYLEISPGGRVNPNSYCTEIPAPLTLDINGRSTGNSYSVKISIMYGVDGIGHEETGILRGFIGN
jgi:hypothetical protein